MDLNINLLGGINIPDNVTKHHYAIAAISGLCTIGAQVGKEYFKNRGQNKGEGEQHEFKGEEPRERSGKKTRSKRREHVASSGEMDEDLNEQGCNEESS